MSEECEQERNLLREKLMKMEVSYQKVQKEMAFERESNMKAKSSCDQERDEFHHTLTQKLEEISTLFCNFRENENRLCKSTIRQRKIVSDCSVLVAGKQDVLVN